MPPKPLALVAAFLALCLLWSFAWLERDLLASPLAPLLQQAFHYGILGVFTAAFVPPRAWCPPAGKSHPASDLLRLALAGIFLLGLPAVLLERASGAISALTISALLAVVPVVIVVARASQQAEQGRTLLAPALAGALGAVLLFPIAIPTSRSEAAALATAVAAVLLIGIASVWLHTLLPAFAIPQAVALIAFANALLLLAVSLLQLPGIHWSPGLLLRETAAAVAFDLPQLLLLVWLLRVLPPQRFAARYLVVPLFAVLQGIVMVRPAVTLQMAAGLLLLLAAAAWMLFAPEREHDSTLVLH